MAAKIEPILTIADLEAMPEDGNRYELIEGELFVSCAPNLKHQGILHGEAQTGCDSWNQGRIDFAVVAWLSWPGQSNPAIEVGGYLLFVYPF
jgi:hypothetical protein